MKNSCVNNFKLTLVTTILFYERRSLAGTSGGSTGVASGGQRDKALFPDDDKISLCLEFSYE